MKIMTPDAAYAAFDSTEMRTFAEVNNGLARGSRSFRVPVSCFDKVSQSMIDAGWSVMVVNGSTHNSVRLTPHEVPS